MGGLPRFFGLCSSEQSERVSNFLSYDEITAGGRPAICFTERQPALIAGDTYHLRWDHQNVRHLDPVIDFSSDLEDLCAHWLMTGSVKPKLEKGGQCQLIQNSEMKQQRRHVGYVEQTKVEGVAAVAKRKGQTASKRR